MQRIRTTELSDHVGQRIVLQGWLHQLRALGGIDFVIIRDGYGTAQAVTQDREVRNVLSGLQNETVLQIEGLVSKELQAPGGIELRDIVVHIMTPVTEVLPFPINKPNLKTSVDVFLDNSTIGLRHPRHRALLRLSSGIMGAFRSFLSQEGFTEIQSPKLVASATESGANVFSVNYFNQKAFLAQSPQFYKQIMVGVLERVFEVGPVFRAEPHDTTRHINEYVSMDVEFGFIEDHFDVMQLLNQLIKYVMLHLETQYSGDLDSAGVKLPSVPIDIPHIHFKDALQWIYEQHGNDCRTEPDLAPQHERWLGEWARQRFGSDFLFVTGYPMVKRPFYTHPDPTNAIYSNSFDLLFRGTELVTGGQRLNRYADYVSALTRLGLPLEPFEYYLKPMRYGMPPHGGFAIGLERFLMQLGGLANIREATLFPRDTHRLTP